MMYTARYMGKEDFYDHFNWFTDQAKEIAGLDDVRITHEEAVAPYGEDVDKIVLHLSFEQAFAMGMDTYNKLEDVFQERVGHSQLLLYYPCTECETGIVEGNSAHFADRDSEHADHYYLCGDCQTAKWVKDQEAEQLKQELTCGFCDTSFKRLRPGGERLWLASVHVGLREEKQEESSFQFTEQTKVLWNGTVEGECFCSEKCALHRIEQYLETVKKELSDFVG